MAWIRSIFHSARHRQEAGAILIAWTWKDPLFEAHAGVGSAELPVDSGLGRVAGLHPRDDLRGAKACRVKTLNSGSVLWSPTAVPGHTLAVRAGAGGVPRRAEKPGQKRRRHGVPMAALRSGAWPGGCADDLQRPAPSQARRLRRPFVGLPRFGLFVPADPRIALTVELAIEVPHRFHRDREVCRSRGGFGTKIHVLESPRPSPAPARDGQPASRQHPSRR